MPLLYVVRAPLFTRLSASQVPQRREVLSEYVWFNVQFVNQWGFFSGIKASQKELLTSDFVLYQLFDSCLVFNMFAKVQLISVVFGSLIYGVINIHDGLCCIWLFELLGATAIPQAAPPAPAPACARNYTVQAGDFCDGISASQNVSTCVFYCKPKENLLTWTASSYQLTQVNSAIIDADCTNLLVGEVCVALIIINIFIHS